MLGGKGETEFYKASKNSSVLTTLYKGIEFSLNRGRCEDCPSGPHARMEEGRQGVRKSSLAVFGAFHYGYRGYFQYSSHLCRSNGGAACPTTIPTPLVAPCVYLVTAIPDAWCLASSCHMAGKAKTIGLHWNFKQNLVQILLFLAPFLRLRGGKRKNPKSNRKGRRRKRRRQERCATRKYKNSLGSLVLYYLYIRIHT